MKPKNEVTRITVEIPKIDHQRLKALAALTGKTMREIIVALIEEHVETISQPNELTKKTMANIEKKENLVATSDIDDLFKKLGI